MTWLAKSGIFTFSRFESNAIIKVVDVLRNFGTNIYFLVFTVELSFSIEMLTQKKYDEHRIKV